MNDEMYEVSYDEFKYETDKSWLLVISGDDYWLPKSKCIIDKKSETISIPLWMAKKKGLY